MPENYEVSMYFGVKDTVGRKVSMDAFMAGIKAASSISGKVIQAREYLADGDRANYNTIKNSLPAITPSGIFPKLHRRDDVANEEDFTHTGLIGIDIDHTLRDYGVEPQVINDYCKNFNGYRGSYITTSDDGCRVYIRLGIVPITEAQHRQAYYQLMVSINEFLRGLSGNSVQVVIDKSCTNPSRINFASYDPNADWQPEREDVYIWNVSEEAIQFAETPVGRPKELPTSVEKVLSVLEHIELQDKSGYRHSSRVRVAYAVKNIGYDYVMFSNWSDKQPFGETSTDNYSPQWWNNIKTREGSPQAGMGTLVELSKQTTDFSISFDPPPVTDERDWVLTDFTADILVEYIGKDIRLWLCDQFGYWQDYSPSFKSGRLVVPPLKYMLSSSLYKRGFFGDFSLKHTSELIAEMAVVEDSYNISSVSSREFNDRNRYPYLVTTDNKVYRIDTGSLIDDREEIRSMKITVDSHKCPPIVIDERVNDFADWFWGHFPIEVWNILADLMHYTTKDVPQILFPKSNSGKGTLITVLKRILGEENIQSGKSGWLSAKSNSSFDYDKRALSTSLLVIFDEINQVAAINMDKFHRLADPTFDNVDTKGEHPRPMRRTANTLLTGADFINLDPSEQGVDTRLTRVIKVSNDEDIDVIDKDKYLQLTATDEGDEAIDSLRSKLIQLATERFGKTYSPTELESDSMGIFLANRTDVVTSELKAMLVEMPDAFVGAKQIKECSSVIAEITSQALNNKITSLFPTARYIRKSSARGFKGLGFREDYMTEESAGEAESIAKDADIPGF